MAVNEAKLNELMGKIVCDMGATLSAALVVIGDRLGLYKAMAARGPMNSTQLAAATHTAERYVREWLLNQAAGGYITYDAASGKYSLTDEQRATLADEDSHVYIPGAFQLMTAVLRDEPKIRKAFQTGEGVDWGDHDPGLFEGTKRFFSPGYRAHLVSEWLPALEGVVDKLRRGAKVADVGCGLGSSTLIMAEAFPKSTFVGFDYHEPSIEAARKDADKLGLNGRVRFEAALADEYPGSDYDFVAFFDCLHDMGDPRSVAKHVHRTLNTSGAWMIVEPFAGDKVEDNLTPVGRLYSAASTLVCCPASLAQKGRTALGAQAGETRLREVITDGGFSRVRLAIQTPFNLIIEARP